MLYDKENYLQYGELQVKDSDGTETMFLYVVAELYIEQYEKPINQPPEGYTTISESLGTRNDEDVKYLLAFFSESADLLKQISQTERDLVVKGLFKLVLAVVSIGFLFLFLGLYRIRHISKKVTKQIIFLYETCNEIIKSGKNN